jgi:hypothetical protein
MVVSACVSSAWKAISASVISGMGELFHGKLAGVHCDTQWVVAMSLQEEHNGKHNAETSDSQIDPLHIP